MPNTHPESASASAGRKLHEIRLAGRGGQGVVTAGDLLGKAAVREGFWAQSIPTFGPERRGALSSATLRMGPEEILLKCSTAAPGVLLVLDPTIWTQFNVTAGLVEEAVLVFNTTEAPEEVEARLRGGALPYRLGVERCRICTVDATGIALAVLGRAITNTAMMGAFCGATGLLGLEPVEAVLAERFGKRASPNIEAARAARDAIRWRA